MLIFERSVPFGLLALTHYLHLDSLGPDIVEHQLGPRNTLDIYSRSDAAFYIFEMLPWLEALMFLDELSEIGGDLEFMGVGVGVLVLA